MGNYIGGILQYKVQLSSPYINRFLQPDSVVPNPANPQDWNRYSYVQNNPIRYNDPTGHICSDPEDPSPSCDGSGTPPPVTMHPPAPAPVVIINPDPLDDGQEQDDPTPMPSETFDETLPNWEIITEGTVLFIALFLIVDIPLGVGFVAFFPEMEAGMILTETWTWPLAVVLVDAHIYAIDLIYEGFTGEEELITPLFNLP